MGVSESDLLHLIIFSVLLSLPISLAEDDPNYTLCSRNFTCGLLQNLSYPFWGGPNRTDVCGRAISELECEVNQYPVVHHYDQKFRMLHVSESLKQMAIVQQELWDDILCPDSLFNQTLVRLPSIDREIQSIKLTFYSNCSSHFRQPSIDRFPCRYNRQHIDEGYGFYSREEIPDEECRFTAEVRVPQESVDNALKYEEDSVCSACEHSGGVCGTNTDSEGFACFCKDGGNHLYCEQHGNGLNMPRKIFIGLGTAGFTVIVMIAIYFFIKRRKDRTKYMPSSFVSRSIDQSLKGDMEKGSKYYGLYIFSYAELEDATSNFEADRELGDGGFGTVYYGKLRDGRSVAVKRLYETNCRRFEQFMNEIDILTRLRHTHLVSLYGCTSRHSRELLLVYEYIPNGTVADHLHGEKAKPNGLPWTIRMNIAVETASALTYLHASDIIHRDVKTNNILLDDNFCVKVADFGLSRLFPTDVTHVSTAPQGTPGYVDPDYHQCYQLTDKSDVFSFGVVLIELVSSLPAVDITRHRHEINLSNLAINKIQNDALHELVDSNLGYDSNYIVQKMINAVAELSFQCLQSDKDLRPSMDEVLERLQSIQSKDYLLNKQEEIGVVSSDAMPLTNKALMLSPDSVMFQWQSSNSTTPNSSGNMKRN